MSQWTHVAGIIRYDWIEALMGRCPLKQVLGIPGDYDNMDRIKDIPSGREGSIQYKILRGGHDSSLAAYVVPIWGDLRDFGEAAVPDIKEWWDRATTGKVTSVRPDGSLFETPVLVRSGILKVDVEYGKTHIFKFESTSDFEPTSNDSD